MTSSSQRADDRDDLPLSNIERDVLQPLKRAIGLLREADFDKRRLRHVETSLAGEIVERFDPAQHCLHPEVDYVVDHRNSDVECERALGATNGQLR